MMSLILQGIRVTLLKHVGVTQEETFQQFSEWEEMRSLSERIEMGNRQRAIKASTWAVQAFTAQALCKIVEIAESCYRSGSVRNSSTLS